MADYPLDELITDLKLLMKGWSPPSDTRDVILNEARRRLRELTELEKDREAWDKLRFASLKRGWQWKWDGLFTLEQVAESSAETFKDPRDAVLKSGTIGTPESIDTDA